MKKFGVGQVIPEEGDDQKTAAKHFTEADRKALLEESEDEDDSKPEA